MASSYEPSKVLSAVASVTASIILFKSIANDLIPDQIHNSVLNFCKRFSSQITVVIQEFEGLTTNHMFEAPNFYLGTKISPSTQKIKVHKPEKDEEFTVTVDKNQEIIDFHAGIKFSWILQSTQVKGAADSDKYGSTRTEFRYFELSFHKKQKDSVLKVYLPYILRKAKEIKEEKKIVRLHTVDYNGIDYWSSVILNHPATLESMAMDPDAKKELIDDLDRFMSRKDYYRRAGRAWKRGYLFFGPPGTGKSSLVAAIANYLKFDVYDLDIKEVQCNSDLRRLLIGVAEKHSRNL